MSLFLFLFYWIVIPALVLLIARLVIRRTKTPLHKGLVITITVAVLLGFLWLAEGRKMYYDWQVRELCAKDGGVKVYETVRLPPDKFNQYGQINFYKPTQGENTLGPEYIYKWDQFYYKKGEPAANGAQEIAMRRDHIKITRKSDMKLMGEVVMYSRGGGDLPGPWVPSSYHCPARLEATEGILMNKIFIKSIDGGNK